MNDDQYARTGRLMFLIAWIILFIILFLFFYYQGKSDNSIYMVNHSELSLNVNQDGHYYIKGRINEYPIEFLLDTGASLVAIPQSIADRLNLSGQYEITLSTANGEVTGYLTRLQQLSFGEFTLKDVKAVIIPGGDTQIVLLGMNVLSHFNLVQQDKRLILKQQSR